MNGCRRQKQVGALTLLDGHAFCRRARSTLHNWVQWCQLIGLASSSHNADLRRARRRGRNSRRPKIRVGVDFEMGRHGRAGRVYLRGLERHDVEVCRKYSLGREGVGGLPRERAIAARSGSEFRIGWAIEVE